MCFGPVVVQRRVISAVRHLGSCHSAHLKHSCRGNDRTSASSCGIWRSGFRFCFVVLISDFPAALPQESTKALGLSRPLHLPWSCSRCTEPPRAQRKNSAPEWARSTSAVRTSPCVCCVTPWPRGYQSTVWSRGQSVSTEAGPRPHISGSPATGSGQIGQFFDRYSAGDSGARYPHFFLPRNTTNPHLDRGDSFS
jgi:hypothetical protein